MQNEITTPCKTYPALPQATQTKLQEWRESPRKSYDSLPEVISHQEIFLSPSPTIAQIKNRLGEPHALMIVSMAIEDVNLMFRKDRRMSEREIVLTAKNIIRRYWYLKPEDIKKCFNGPRPKSFVLEGDSFLSWLAEYDLQRDNVCEDVAYNGKKEAQNRNTLSYDQYKKKLTPEQRESLERLEKKFITKPIDEEQKHRKRNEEFAFMTKYRDNIKKGIRQEWQKEK